MIFQVMKSLDPRKDVVVSFMALWITVVRGKLPPKSAGGVLGIRTNFSWRFEWLEWTWMGKLNESKWWIGHCDVWLPEGSAKNFQTAAGVYLSFFYVDFSADLGWDFVDNCFFLLFFHGFSIIFSCQSGLWRPAAATQELCRTHVPQPTCVRVFQAITAQAPWDPPALKITTGW